MLIYRVNKSAEAYQRWQNQTWNPLAAYHKLRPCCMLLVPRRRGRCARGMWGAGALFEFICQCWVINNCWRLRQWSLIGRWKTICYVGCQRATPPPPLHCLHQARHAPAHLTPSAGHMASLSNNPGSRWYPTVHTIIDHNFIMKLYLNWI